VNLRVRHSAFARFKEVVYADGFRDRLRKAAEEISAGRRSAETEALSRELLPLLATAGKDRPWSRLERSAVIPKMLGILRRHGDPAVFYTISLDDVHQTISIRLSFPCKSNSDFVQDAARRMQTWQMSVLAMVVAHCGGIWMRVSARRRRTAGRLK
jgi:hypothetical protein